jgi:hypothetical protein
MPGYTVVNEVSQSLVGVLQEGLTVVGATVATDDLQGPVPGTLYLSVFLFEVGEDPNSRNRPRARTLAAPDIRIARPPLSLHLRYLLTPWGSDEAARHLLLGRAMQVLNDHPILSGAQLVGDLADEDQTINIVMSPMSLEDRTRVWHAVQKPYRLSVSYDVRVVHLDSETPQTVRPVRERGIGQVLPGGGT